MKVKPNKALPWPIDYEEGVLFLAGIEDCRLKAYLCQAGKWSCGWGETDGVGSTTVWTQKYADQRFCDSLTERTEAVKALCTVEPTTYQLTALVSLAYNIGLEALRKSTVLRMHNKSNFLAAARAFSLFNKYRDPQTKKLTVSAGLTARRAREAALYLRLSEGVHDMPQQVAPQSRLVASPIAGGGAATVGAGLVAAIGQAGDQVGTVSGAVGTAKSFATETLGIPADWLLPLFLVVVGGVILWYRAKQRSQGFA